MSDNYSDFLNSVSSDTVKFLKPYRKIGEIDYTDCTLEDIEKVILSFNPANPRAITTVSNILVQYARFLNDTHMEAVVKSVNRSELWNKFKHDMPSKFISYEQYVDLCNQILISENFNSLYKRTLFMAAYEGIFSDDLSVYKNLRASNIHGNTVTIYDDNGNSRDVEISETLTNCLLELSSVFNWERQNKYNAYSVDISGEYNDCCFKLEKRANSNHKPNAYKDNYYRIFRTVSNEYLGYSITAKQVYVSGIMYRACQKMKSAGIDPKEIMLERKHSNSDKINSILKEEFQRSGYMSTTANFKEYIRGHVDIFLDNE